MPLEQKYLCDRCSTLSTPEELTSKYYSPEGVAHTERSVLHCPECGSSELLDWNPEQARRLLDSMISLKIWGDDCATQLRHVSDLILEMEETYID